MLVLPTKRAWRVLFVASGGSGSKLYKMTDPIRRGLTSGIRMHWAAFVLRLYLGGGTEKNGGGGAAGPIPRYVRTG
jgi:hypothetical protein